MMAKAKREMPHWRVMREMALEGRRRIKYNWGWKSALSSIIRIKKVTCFGDGWQN